MNWAMAFWTADGLSPEHTAQVLNYLKATGKKNRNTGKFRKNPS
jgi:hypothetical protein